MVGTLGAGGVGVVYEGVDDALGRPVALKVLRDDSADNIARFRREARAMSRLSHPNVATVYEVSEAEGQRYIAMELVRGRTLRQWLLTVRTPTEIVEVVRQAGQGLAAAHAAGLVHRDFKPDNVLVGDDGRVRVVDFGLAKHRSEVDDDRPIDHAALARELADAGITRTGSLMGTPAYMAPESFVGNSDARSDQFALCVVLYEALYGLRPFAGETAEDLLRETSEGRMRPWPTEQGVPSTLATVLRQGLSPDGADRHPSMAALLDAIADAMAGNAPTRRHRTKGMRSWKWRAVGAATGLLLAAANAALGSGPTVEQDDRAASVEAASAQPELEHEPATSPTDDERPALRGPARASQDRATMPARPAQS